MEILMKAENISKLYQMGELEVVARFPDGMVRISNISDLGRLT